MSSPADRSETPTILIAEDEQIVARDLERTLAEIGYSVSGTTDDGSEAVELAGKTRPHVVLMNIRLRGKTGSVAAADEIRRKFHIPVVFMTSGSSDEMPAQGGAHGSYGYVVKPFRPAELKASILLALHEHGVGHDLFAEHTWLGTVLGCLTDGVIATDETGRVRFLNSSAEALTGWNRADAIGKSVEKIYRLTTLDGEAADLYGMLRAQRPGTQMTRKRFLLTRRDGTVVPVEDATAPIGIRDGADGAVIVFTDIAERLRREREQRVECERLEVQVQNATEALGDTQAELRALSAHLMRAQEDERRRVARELHDDLGQRVAALEFNLNRLQEGLGPAAPALQAEIRAVLMQTAELSTSLRSVTHALHSPVIADLGIETALRMLIDEHRGGGEDVGAVFQDIPERLPFDVSVAVYRIVQEALRNASRHAKGAPVMVELLLQGKELKLSVSDGGPGFSLLQVREKGGLGLLSIQERARLAGGTFLLRSEPGQGTSLLVSIPIESATT
jgi:PAS domain S-box-containing protein